MWFIAIFLTGSYLYNNVMGKSYANMFAINASFLFISIVYSLIALKVWSMERESFLDTEFILFAVANDV